MMDKDLLYQRVSELYADNKTELGSIPNNTGKLSLFDCFLLIVRKRTDLFVKPVWIIKVYIRTIEVTSAEIILFNSMVLSSTNIASNQFSDETTLLDTDVLSLARTLIYFKKEQ